MTLPELEQVLVNVGRLPEARQRDAADCIRRTLAMDEARARHWSDPPASPDLPQEIFEGLPPHLTARLVPRDPYVANSHLTHELAEEIRRIREAAEPWQRCAAGILSSLIENDQWDVILPPDFELRRG